VGPSAKDVGDSASGRFVLLNQSQTLCSEPRSYSIAKVASLHKAIQYSARDGQAQDDSLKSSHSPPIHHPHISNLILEDVSSRHQSTCVLYPQIPSVVFEELKTQL
jgi:hypothetical protein